MTDVETTLAQAVGARVRARSTRRILDAARQLIDVDGVDSFSMRRLADSADVSVRTIYNLFGDKQGLLAALVRDSFDAMEVVVGELGATDPIERIWEAVTVSVEVNCQYVPRAVVAAITTDTRLQRDVASYWPGHAMTLDALESATRSRALRADIGPAALMEQAGIVFMHLLWRWSQGEIDQDELTAAALHAFDVCLLAVATPATRTRLLAHVDGLQSRLPEPITPTEELT